MTDATHGTAPGTATRAWACLYAAIALDVAGVFALAASDGLRHPAFLALAMALFVVEIAAFGIALTSVDTSVAYALYGLGTATVATIGIAALGEPADPPRIAALAAVVLGAVLLNTA
jgi:multidrug transporter EmrE-like cation transporter